MANRRSKNFVAVALIATSFIPFTAAVGMKTAEENGASGVAKSPAARFYSHIPGFHSRIVAEVTAHDTKHLTYWVSNIPEMGAFSALVASAGIMLACPFRRRKPAALQAL
jgi:hypothetical protein